MKKLKKKPQFMISADDNEMKAIRELRDEYDINISSFVRRKLLELHGHLKNQK